MGGAVRRARWLAQDIPATSTPTTPSSPPAAPAYLPPQTIRSTIRPPPISGRPFGSPCPPAPRSKAAPGTSDGRSTLRVSLSARAAQQSCAGHLRRAVDPSGLPVRPRRAAKLRRALHLAVDPSGLPVRPRRAAKLRRALHLAVDPPGLPVRPRHAAKLRRAPPTGGRPSGSPCPPAPRSVCGCRAAGQRRRWPGLRPFEAPGGRRPPTPEGVGGTITSGSESRRPPCLHD